MAEAQVLDLTGLTKLKFPDGAKKGFLWKFSDSRHLVIFLAAPKGPKGQKWNKPFRFKSVKLYNGISNGAPLLDTLKKPPPNRSAFFAEGNDHSNRQVWHTKFKDRRKLPKTPCTLVFDGHYIVIPRPQDRND